jgi:uncharacterized membrane protein
MHPRYRYQMIRHIVRTVLGAALTYAGITHLTSSRQEFQAQVPTILQSQADFVVIASGVVEILLGLSLILLIKYRTYIGWITAAFFIAIFPGNISQYINGTDAFGLNTDQARAIRLLFQPLLVIWALWSTGAWKSRKAGK